MQNEAPVIDDELDALAAEVAAQGAPRRGRTAGGQHLGGMNREQYRRTRRTWGHVHGGKHPKGQLTSRRSRLVQRSRTRAAQGEPFRSIRLVTAGQNRERRLDAQVLDPHERLFELMAAAAAGWRRPQVTSDRRVRQAIDRQLTRMQGELA